MKPQNKALPPQDSQSLEYIDRYLDGLLSEEETDKFEERCYTDTAFFVEVRKREIFRGRVSDMLQAHSEEAEAILAGAEPGVKEKVQRLFELASIRKPILGYAFGVVALVFLVGNVWLITRDFQKSNKLEQLENSNQTLVQNEVELQQQIVEQKTQNTQLSKQLEREKQTQREVLHEKDERIDQLMLNLDTIKKQKNQLEHELARFDSLSPFIASYDVEPVRTRSPMAKKPFAVSQETLLLQLKLSIDIETDYIRFDAELRKVGEENIILSRAKLKYENKKLIWNVPADILSENSYQVTLYAKTSSDEKIFYYYFSVTRK